MKETIVSQMRFGLVFDNVLWSELVVSLRKLPILRANYDKLHSKLPIFCVKSVKVYTGQFFFYTDTVCGVCDKYEVWYVPHCIVLGLMSSFLILLFQSIPNLCLIFSTVVESFPLTEETVYLLCYFDSPLSWGTNSGWEPSLTHTLSEEPICSTTSFFSKLKQNWNGDVSIYRPGTTFKFCFPKHDMDSYTQYLMNC